jgi:Leucine-rich repeat (LRR) protein
MELSSVSFQGSDEYNALLLESEDVSEEVTSDLSTPTCIGRTKICCKKFFNIFSFIDTIFLFALRIGVSGGISYIISVYLAHGRALDFWLFFLLLLNIYSYATVIKMVYLIVSISRSSNDKKSIKFVDNATDNAKSETRRARHIDRIKLITECVKNLNCVEKLSSVRRSFGQYFFLKGKYYVVTMAVLELIGHGFHINTILSIQLCKMPVRMTSITTFVYLFSVAFDIATEKYLKESKLIRDRKILLKVFVSLFNLAFPLAYIWFKFQLPITSFSMIKLLGYDTWKNIASSNTAWKSLVLHHAKRFNSNIDIKNKGQQVASINYYNINDNSEEFTKIYEDQLDQYPAWMRTLIKVCRYCVATFFVTLLAMQISTLINFHEINEKCNDKLTTRVWDACKLPVPFCVSSFTTKSLSSCDCAVFMMANYSKPMLPVGMNEMSSLLEVGIASSQITHLPSDFCEIHKKLIVVRLYKTNLTKLPENIGKCKELEELWATNSKLTYVPEGITKLQKLVQLRLNGNKIKLLPANLGNLNSMLSLWVYKNYLEELPESIGNMKVLMKVFAWSNRIVKLPSSLTKLKLRELMVHDNQITSLPKDFGDLKELYVLYIWNNRLLSLPNSMSKLKRLKYIDIRHNFITKMPSTTNWKPFYFLAASNPICAEGSYSFPNKLERMKNEEICEEQCGIDCTKSWLVDSTTRTTCEDNDQMYSFAKHYGELDPNDAPVPNAGCNTKKCDYGNGRCPRQ